MRAYNVSTFPSFNCIVKFSEGVKLYQSVKYDMNTNVLRIIFKNAKFCGYIV